MGRLVQLVHGVWERAQNGEWRFVVVDDGPKLAMTVGENEKYDGLVGMVRSKFYAGPSTAIGLTYQFPEWMLVPDGKRTLPIDIKEDGDVELFLAIQVDYPQVMLCVTIGAYHVDRYRFQRRSNFDTGGSSHSFGEISCELNLQPESYRPLANTTNAGQAGERTFGGMDDAMGFWEGLGTADIVPTSTQVIREVCTDEERMVLESYHKSLIGGVSAMPTTFAYDGSGSSSDSSDNVLADMVVLGSEEDTDLPSGSFAAAVGNLNLVTPVIEGADVVLHSDSSSNTDGGVPMDVVTDKGKGVMVESTQAVRPQVGVRIGGHAALMHEPGDAVQLVTELCTDDEDDVGDWMHDARDLYVGMKFKNRDAFKLHMSMFAITHKFCYHNKRSTPNVMVLECTGRNCPWRVYAVKMSGSDWYQVRRVRSDHNCSVDERLHYERHATTAVIGGVMRNRYNSTGAGPNPQALMEMMRDNHNVPISYWKAWKSREVAMDTAKGKSSASYEKLPVYLHQLVASNPGTVVALETSGDEIVGQRFKYLFVALGASIAGVSYMRKVVVVDGTHLKGKYGGCLMTASAQDGNNQIYPIGFGIVDGENDSSWSWFFAKLQKIVPDSENLVFVSDRHSSIYAGLRNVYPRSQHCACILHLQRNIQTIFKKRELSYLVGRAARAYHLRNFYENFNEIKKRSVACADYLIGIGFEHWARSHFMGVRYNLMTSNIAEALNAALGEARELPIVPLLEGIRSTLMEWFNRRRASANNEASSLTPKAQENLSKNFEMSGGFGVRRINGNEFEVRDKSGVPYHVDLGNKNCSCCEFQMLRIPCAHAVAAAVRSKTRVDALVDCEYTADFWRLSYAQSIYPVTEVTAEDQIADAIQDLHLGPPLTRRPPGRPRKQRFLSRGEFRGSVRRRLVICGRCGRLGHNRVTCKMPI